MATVSGISAAKMLELSGEDIVDGLVDSNGNLILTKRNGGTVNAGAVKGDPGQPGQPGATFTIPDSDWLAPSLAASWQNLAGAGWSDAGYRKIGGVTYLRGLIQTTIAGTAGSQTRVVFTLPATYRPEQDMHLNIPNSTNDHARINIMGDGTVKLNFFTLAMAVNGWICLDGISFPADK